MESEDLIFDLIYDALKTKDRRKKILFKDREHNISEYELESIKKYLLTISPNYSKKFYSIVKEFNANQLAVLLETIRSFRKQERPANQLIREIKDIHKGIFPRHISYKTEYTSGCLETYSGFIRALNSGTLYTAKVKINGELKRVFIKTPIGHVYKNSSNNQGFLSFAIDPETMNVYSYRFNEKGKIHNGSLEEVYNFKEYETQMVEQYSDESKTNFKQNYLDFRKELLDRIDAVYGIERVVDTFLRMGGKVDPEKYSNPEFREEMINYLEEKFGTDKLLNWVSKIKDSKKAAEVKLEILKILSMKFRPEFRKAYNSENKIAAKEYINSFSKRKIIIKPRKPL
ncbi:MAG: hypothetical protein WCX82_02005 [archaeon]|jgi:hypothetical protein